MSESIVNFVVQYWLGAVFALIIYFIKRYYHAKSEKRSRELEESIREERERLKKREEELFLMDCFQTSIQALLRDRIYQMYTHYTDKGVLPLYARENVTDMYIEYKKLRGNGMVEELIKTLNKLPNTPPHKENE